MAYKPFLGDAEYDLWPFQWGLLNKYQRLNIINIPVSIQLFEKHNL